MFSKQDSVLQKGDIVINPKTNRPIKVGSRTWLKLVKDGVMDSQYDDPVELCDVGEMVNPAQIQHRINQLDKLPPDGVQTVRGRGRYQNKLVKRIMKPSPQQITKMTAKTGAKVICNNIDKLSECDDLEQQIEQMILAEMLEPKIKQYNHRNHNIEYVTHDTPIYDECDDSEAEYDHVCD